jgi:glycine dehydrogenase subunit 2
MGQERDTGFHTVIWNEPIIYKLGRKGRRGQLIPQIEKEIKKETRDILSDIPAEMLRKDLSLPELSEVEVVRHYLRLSQQIFGFDESINIGQGTCSMKYSPKLNEHLVLYDSRIADVHPSQDEETIQGILEIAYNLKKALIVLSGMTDFSLTPRGGTHGVFSNALVIAAYHRRNGEKTERNEIITTAYSHPCNSGAPATAGFKVIALYPDSETGCPNIEALKSVVSKRTAGLMVTDPYDTGVFDPNIKEYIKTIHEVGGLVAWDSANANSFLGLVRQGDVGADLVQYNLHKTFSSPHGSYGPGSAAVGAQKELADFLPVPIVEYDDEKKRYYLNYGRKYTIGRISGFYGTIPCILKAYSRLRAIGRENIKQVSEIAILNNNYLTRKMLEIPGISLPYSGYYPYRLEQSRFSLQKLKEETGVGTDDANRRIVDYGIESCWTSHHPLIVPEPVTPEPTESFSKEDVETFAMAFREISKEAYADPESVKNAPHNCPIHKIDESMLNDSKKCAMTWRSYIKKTGI